MLVRERKRLNRILSDLRRAQAYILSDSIHVCRESRGSTTVEYANRDGQYLMSMEKRIGSELALLHTAIRDLDQLLSPTVTDA